MVNHVRCRGEAMRKRADTQRQWEVDMGLASPERVNANVTAAKKERADDGRGGVEKERRYVSMSTGRGTWAEEGNASAQRRKPSNAWE